MKNFISIFLFSTFLAFPSWSASATEMSTNIAVFKKLAALENKSPQSLPTINLAAPEIVEQVQIQVIEIGDPHRIKYSVPPSFEGTAKFVESWPYKANRLNNQTWFIGYSTEIGPYIYWAERNEISRIESASVHPLDILIEEGEGCSGTNAEIKACKARVLELWKAEYERAKTLALNDGKAKLVNHLEDYRTVYEENLFQAYSEASGSQATNTWRWKQIKFLKFQIELLLGIHDFYN